MKNVLSNLRMYENIINEYSISDIEEAEYILSTPFINQCVHNYLNLKRASNDYVQYDAMNETYKRKDSDVYETIREKTLEKLDAMTDISEQVKLIMETAKQLKEAAFFLEYNHHLKKCHEVLLRINVCRNMMIAGASLTEIVKYVPNAEWADVYHLGEKYLGIKLDLSVDEKKKVEEDENKEKEEHESMASLFGIPDSNGLVPYYDKSEKCWVLKGESSEYRSSALDIAQKFVGYDLRYPYFIDGQKILYKNTFEEVIEEVLLNPNTFSISSVEEFYSKSEYMLIEKIQKKLNNSSCERNFTTKS